MEAKTLKDKSIIGLLAKKKCVIGGGERFKK